jgi:nucleotide-binding universal stress UspA family protein
MLRSLLAAVDQSDAADEVLRAAWHVAARTDAALHVVHACGLPPVVVDAVVPGMAPINLAFQPRLDQAAEALDACIGRAASSGVAVASRKVVPDAPHRAILQRAREVHADLVVLGPHRHATLDARLLGTTADRVARTADVPCLVVRCYLNLPLTRVVVPLDLSEPAAEALDVALEWLVGLGPHTPGFDAPAAELRVVHVLPQWVVGAGFRTGHATVGPELHREVGAALERSGHAGRVRVREDLLWGEGTAEQIVRYAADERAGLVVMATHGRGALERALIGSVTAAVARDAGCCVLLVPPSRWTRTRR